MRYAQLVIGPAGSGKSFYCSSMVHHGTDSNRRIDVVNLDPAAEHFDYQPLADIRELIHLQDTMEDEELHFGPNGGLVFCLEYLVENADWLQEQLGDHDDDYILFDCPGQIELYTHLTAMKKLLRTLQKWNFNVCAVFLLDVQFMTDAAKFISGTMTALSVMVNLEVPHVNLLTKVDLLSKGAKRHLDRFLAPDAHALMGDVEAGGSKFSERYKKLTEAIGALVEDYGLVRLVPLNWKCEENVRDVLVAIDNVLQYGEDQDVRTRDFDYPEEDE